MNKEKAGKGSDAGKKKRAKARSAENLAAWMPRREACEVLNSSRSTLRAWEGKRFRAKRVGRGRDVRVYYHRDDVERTRLDKLGPRQWEIERAVLSSLDAGDSPFQILARLSHVTLGDVERIRDHDARLSGACIVEREHVRELRQLLGVEMFRGETLVAHVRALVLRVEKLAVSRTNRTSEPPPPKAANGSN